MLVLRVELCEFKRGLCLICAFACSILKYNAFVCLLSYFSSAPTFCGICVSYLQYKMGNRVKKRPAVDYLLDVIGYPNFEVVIYTSEAAINASPVVEVLDSKQKIMYKLYRDCCKYMNGVYVKVDVILFLRGSNITVPFTKSISLKFQDLSKLNRDLSKVIYIDFDPAAFQLNPENVLRLPKWEGTLDDTALVDLAELLKSNKIFPFLG